MNKNKLFVGFLAGLLTISLAGCGNTTQTAEKESINPASQTIQSADVTSATGPSDDTTAEESKPPAVEPKSSEISESTPTQTAEEKTQEKPSQENAVPHPPAQNKQPVETQTPKPEEPKPTPPQSVQPQTPAPAEVTPAEPEPPAPQPSEEPKEPEFDVGYWVSFAKGYAQSIGLELDSEAVSCWDNPIIASANSKYLERDLCGMLNKYNRDADITAIWIWAEPRTAGSWDIYIGYA